MADGSQTALASWTEGEPRRRATAGGLGDGMDDVQRVTVVILATHPLLGEGLAKSLGCADELAVTHVPFDDAAAVEVALASGPDVVIVERNDAIQPSDLLRFAPDALIIDVGIDNGHVFSTRREEIPAQPDGILDAIRGMRRHAALAPVSALLVGAAVALGTGLR